VQVGGVPGASGIPGPQLLLSAPQSPLTGCSFARNDPRAVATCCDDGTVAVWDMAVGGWGPQLYVPCFAVSPTRWWGHEVLHLVELLVLAHVV
jgi:hypothetical protein